MGYLPRMSQAIYRATLDEVKKGSSTKEVFQAAKKAGWGIKKFDENTGNSYLRFLEKNIDKIPEDIRQELSELVRNEMNQA